MMVAANAMRPLVGYLQSINQSINLLRLTVANQPWCVCEAESVIVYCAAAATSIVACVFDSLLFLHYLK